MSDNEQTTMEISKRKPAERTQVVGFRITPKAAEDLTSIVKVLGVSKGEWLEGVINRDRRALGNIKDAVIDLQGLQEVISILKAYCVFAPSRFEMIRMRKHLERLEADLKKALAEAPSFF